MKISQLQASNQGLYNTDKFTDHSYNDFYDELFKDREAPLDILEVGVYQGGSVRLWHDYLKNAGILGLDIDPICADSPEYPRLKIETIDAYNPATEPPFIWWGSFDVVVDDGPHTAESQIYAMKNFPAYLKPGGVLVIEDVPEGAEAEIIKHAPAGGTVSVENLRSVKDRWDDCLIVFKKDVE